MDKRIALHGLALLGLLASTTAVAQTESGFYVGAGIGEATIEIDDTGFDDSDTAFKVFGGYDINRFFAVEAAYFDGGTAEQELAGMSFVGSTEVDTSGFDLAALGRLPINDVFSVHAKIGIASYDVDTTIRVSSRFGQSVTKENISDEDVLFGFGAAFDIGASFGLRAEYETVEASDGDFTLLSISGLFRF